MSRLVCWFSCGAASAVATKIALAENAGRLPVEVVRVYVEEEHPDNERFAADCERWFGAPIRVLRDEIYGASIYGVFQKERYIAGVAGAACTRRLKKHVREAFERPGDRQVFGYTAEEQDRADRFIDANSHVDLWPVLIEKGLGKADCLAMVERAGIELPAMYALGYRNNNCVGCVKGGAGYWNKVRADFPEAFDRMATLSRSLGVRMMRNGEDRIFLDELQIGAGDYPAEPEVQCGIFCEMAERDYAPSPKAQEAE
jgi:hypothetical protein